LDQELEQEKALNRLKLAKKLEEGKGIAGELQTNIAKGEIDKAYQGGFFERTLFAPLKQRMYQLFTATGITPGYGAQADQLNRLFKSIGGAKTSEEVSSIGNFELSMIQSGKRFPGLDESGRNKLWLYVKELIDQKLSTISGEINTATTKYFEEDVDEKLKSFQGQGAKKLAEGVKYFNDLTTKISAYNTNPNAVIQVRGMNTKLSELSPEERDIMKRYASGAAGRLQGEDFQQEGFDKTALQKASKDRRTWLRDNWLNQYSAISEQFQEELNAINEQQIPAEEKSKKIAELKKTTADIYNTFADNLEAAIKKTYPTNPTPTAIEANTLTRAKKQGAAGTINEMLTKTFTDSIASFSDNLELTAKDGKAILDGWNREFEDFRIKMFDMYNIDIRNKDSLNMLNLGNLKNLRIIQAGQTKGLGLTQQENTTSALLEYLEKNTSTLNDLDSLFKDSLEQGLQLSSSGNTFGILLKGIKDKLESSTTDVLKGTEFTTDLGIKGVSDLGQRTISGIQNVSESMKSYAAGLPDKERKIAELKIDEITKQQISKVIDSLIKALEQVFPEEITGTPEQQGSVKLNKADLINNLIAQRNKNLAGSTTASNKSGLFNSEQDEREAEQQIKIVQDTLGKISNIYSLFYANQKQKVEEEVNAWKEAQQEKLDTEHQTALSYARTTKQKENIDKAYKKKEKDLNDAADAEKLNRLKAWFEWEKQVKVAQVGVDAAAAIVNMTSSHSSLIELLGPGAIPFIIAAESALAIAEIAAIEGQTMPAAKGFETGGYTGDGDKKKKAGIVHKQEFVVKAKPTKKNRSLLEAINDETFSVDDVIAKGNSSLVGKNSMLNISRDYQVLNIVKMIDNKNSEEIKSMHNTLKEYLEKDRINAIGDDACRRIVGIGVKGTRQYKF
ncbi:MAG: hypothetical protein PHS84_06290, partial [Paludibacter sp.]|nr:hypothetical protein [Paludibacter sp.]